MDQNNAVNVTLTGKDEISSVLRTIQQSLAEVGEQAGLNTGFLAQMAEGLQRLRGATQQGIESNNQLAAAYIALAQSINQQTQGYTQAQQATLAYRQQQDALRESLRQQREEQRQANEAARQSAQVWQQVTQQIIGVAGGLGLATSIRGAVAELVDFGKSIIETGARLEQLHKSLNAVTGGTQQGAEAYREITRIANTYGFSIETLATQYKNFAAATRGTIIEGEQTKRIFEAVTLAGRNLGATNQQMEGAFRALEQMVSKGTVSMEELRRQLGNALPGAFELAARAMGVTTQRLEEMVRNGEVQAIPFLVRLGELFRREMGGSATEAANSATTAFAQLENAWLELKDRIARAGPLRLVAQVVRSGAAFIGQGQREEDAANREVEQRAGPGGLVGATQAQLDALRRLNQELKQPPVMTEGGILPRRSQEQIELDRQAILNDIAAQRSLQKVEADRNADDEAHASEQVARNTERQTSVKNLTDAIEALNAEEERLQRQAQRAPQRFGSPTGTPEQQVEFFTRLQKLRGEAVEKLTGLMDTREQQRLGATPDDIAKGVGEAITRLQQADDQLEKAEQAIRDRRKAARDAEAADRKAQREEQQERDRETRNLQQDIAQLEQYARQLGLTKTERIDLTAAEIAARHPENEVVQRLAAQVKAHVEMQDAIEASKERVQEFAKTYDLLGLNLSEAEERQLAFNKRVEAAIALLQTPRADRQTTILDNLTKQSGQFQGAQFTDEQRARVDAAQQARDQSQEIERIFRDMGRSIDRTFTDLWEQIFSGGVKNARDFGLTVVQSLQKIFASLASNMLNILLSQLTGAKFSEGGTGGALAGVLLKLVGSIGSAAVGGGAGGDYGGLSQGFNGSSLPYEFGTFASGGIVRTPTFALIGESGPEMVVPLTGQGSPFAHRRSQPQPQASQPSQFNVSVYNDYAGSIDPRSLRPTKKEITSVVIEEILTDGSLRRVIQSQR